jgi:transcriptional regulator with XRE-family HTH domain
LCKHIRRVMEQLARLRELKGFSQRALAKESGVSPATIYELENGRRRANPSTLRKLASALDVEVADLLGAEYPKEGRRSSLEPSFEDVLEDERREAIYEPWLEYANRFADRWEARIAAGDFDLGNVNEFIATLEDLMPTLHKLNAAEVQELPKQPSSFGAPGAKTGLAIWRLADLLDPLAQAGAAKFGVLELEESSSAGAAVTNLQEFRDRVANMQHRVAG